MIIWDLEKTIRIQKEMGVVKDTWVGIGYDPSLRPLGLT